MNWRLFTHLLEENPDLDLETVSGRLFSKFVM
jgi:hypothetical protein